MVDSYAILEICRAFDTLGTAVQEQLEDVANGCDLEDLNVNALAMIHQFCKQTADRLEVIGEDSEVSEEFYSFAERIEEYLAEAGLEAAHGYIRRRK